MRANNRTPRRRAMLVIALIGTLALGSGIAAALATQPPAPTPTTTPVAPTQAPPALTPTQRMLLDSDNPHACVISFTGADLSPQLQSIGERYLALPLPRKDGAVFAGWYPDDDAALSRNLAARVNGADVVTCDDRRERTLHAAWLTPAQATAEPARVPILMYHQFTTKPEGEGGWLAANFYGVNDWRADMTYIRDEGFYLPTWDELDAFIDGALWLPARSVIITDDDADSTWLSLAVPIVDELDVLTTSFVITTFRHEPTPSMWVLQRSHTDDMHRAGANGRGLMVNASADEIAADLRASAAVLGAAEVVAYPYGHYDDRSKQGVAAAGFDLAVTTEHGYVEVGSDKLALPRVRMNFGMTVDDLRGLIG